MATHYDLGKQGEDLSVKHLIQNGYEILTRNFRYQKAEVDILARKDSVLAVVEVKTRSNSYHGAPEEFLKPQQINRLIKAVNFFVQERAIDLDVRFDIISVVKNKKGVELNHLEDAFLYF